MEHLNFTVTGTAPAELKELTASIITQALTANGFSSVTNYDVKGEEAEQTDFPSLWNWVKQKNPALFDTPIGIYQSPYVSNESLRGSFVADAIANTNELNADEAAS